VQRELGPHAGVVADAERRWERDDGTRRLWARDASLFSGADEARWLGWLDLPTAPPEVAIGAAAARAAVADHPADAAVVLGMGGSSLWPDVLARTFAGGARRRRLAVLDTTVPDAVEGFLSGLALERTLFFVSSKSGSTIEPNALFELIHARLAARHGAERAGRHFVAITDPGSALESRAKQAGFAAIALGRPDVGGRFSALSPFGLLPAVALGLDPESLRARAAMMAEVCGPASPVARNPGVGLGLALGALAGQGRDKLTLSLSPKIASFGGWIEQLVAESTGKHGRGILPIADEPLGGPERYAADRVFVDVALADDATRAARHAKLAALAVAGHPVIRIELADAFDLGGAIFQWEMATAVVCALLGVNPFDQPDVEAAKVASRAVLAASTAAASQVGTAARSDAALEADGVHIHASEALAAATRDARNDPVQAARALVGSLRAGDGFLINVFLPESDAIRAPLERLRARLGARTRAATALAFGPRYLHSTGQLQKGGPDTLVGLQIWQSAGARKPPRLAIPGLGGDFDTLAEAQAVGDFRVLSERGRRMLGIDVGADAVAGVERIAAWLERALA